MAMEIRHWIFIKAVSGTTCPTSISIQKGLFILFGLGYFIQEELGGL
jgi:hypothetical protein